mgnify:CR=1 FL=1
MAATSARNRARDSRPNEQGDYVRIPVDPETWELIERYNIDVLEAVKRHLEKCLAEVLGNVSRSSEARDKQ